MKYLIVPILLVFLVSCKEEPESIDIQKPKQPVVVDNTISTDFNLNNFTAGVEEGLLKEIRLCDPNAKTDDDPAHPSCSPRFFRFFQLTKSRPMKDGFILLTKAGVNGFPIRRIYIFEREKGELIKVNGFNGNLIERRPSKSGYDDLVIRFPDNIENDLIYYNCLFQWKNGTYEYKYCEEIDEGMPRKVKKEFIDSMGGVIKGILDKNNMLF
jgi:hypothetical protein